MTEYELNRAWAAFQKHESADVTELEAMTYGLFLKSFELTSYMDAYPHMRKSTGREYYLTQKTEQYVRAFGQFAVAVARDHGMNDGERWTALKLTMLNEEERRMLPARGGDVEAKMIFDDLDMEFMDAQLEKLGVGGAIDDDTVGALTEAFSDAATKDIDLYKKVVDA